MIVASPHRWDPLALQIGRWVPHPAGGQRQLQPVALVRAGLRASEQGSDRSALRLASGPPLAERAAIGKPGMIAQPHTSG